MSGYCGSCGSTDFTLVDGFFYCAVCNSQSQFLREFDHEDEGAVLTSMLATKIRKKDATAKREKGTKAEEVPAEEEEYRLPAVKQEDFPKYLGHAGLRLATFTKLLSRFSATLIRDFGVPECLKSHVLNILQLYLKHYDVAFCNGEVDENNPYSPLVKNEDYEAQKKAKREKVKAQKEAQLKRGEDVMSLLSSADIRANLDAQVTDFDTEDIEPVIEQRTSLSTSALSKLLDIPVNIEMIMAVLYMGCLSSGANWMLLSDITRWFREGRFPMTLFHRSALFVGRMGDDIYEKKGLSFCTATPDVHVRSCLTCSRTRRCTALNARTVVTVIMPLYEYVRTILVLCQLTDIPVHPLSYSFEQVLARLSYNLNLPLEFMCRLHAISITFTPNVVFNAHFTRRFGTVDSEGLLKKSTDRFCDNINFAVDEGSYQSRLKTHKRQYREFTICLEGTAFGCENITHVTFITIKERMDELLARRYSVMPSVEVKAVAVILFALKLMFGLNDNLEFNVEKRSDALNANDEVFDFGCWIHQLKMRTNAWRGRRLKNVLEKRTTALHKYDDVFENYRLVFERTNRKGEKAPVIGGGFPAGGRNLQFRGCVPSNFIMEERDYALFSTFEDDFDLQRSENLEKEALLTPLRYQATRNHEWYEKEFEGATVAEDNSNGIDRYNTEVFFKSFKHHRMEYAVSQTSACSKVQKDEVPWSSDVKLTKWRQMFPCSSHYETYPRPLYCPGLVKPYESGELRLYIPMIYTSAVDVIYQCASPHFSDSFSDLLENLALMIGEDIKVVYTMFLMLEMKCLMHRTLHDLYEIIENCENFTTCAQIEILGEKPCSVEIQMQRIDENVSQEDFRFTIIDFVKISGFEKQRKVRRTKQARRWSYSHQTPQKRRKRQIRRQNIFKTGSVKACGAVDRTAETYNEELRNNFERMVLRSHGEQKSTPCEQDQVETGADVTVQSTVDVEEISDVDAAPVQISGKRKRRKSGPFARMNVFHHWSLENIKNRFAEYFNFEFEAAFALTIPKYW